jgi:hypothetical protein
MAKLTPETVTDRISTAIFNNSARNTAFDLDLTYYELEFIKELGLPVEYESDGAVLPTARDIVDAGCDHISTAYAKFYRPCLGVDDKARHQAEMLRKFDSGMFYMTKMDSPISPWRDADKHAFLHGMWCFETLYDPYKGGEEPIMDDGEGDSEFNKRKKLWKSEKDLYVPISIRAVHPKNIYPDTAREPNYVVIQEEKLITQVAMDWPKWYAEQIKNPDAKTSQSQTITQQSYWDNECRSVKLNGHFVPDLPDEVNRHEYGFIPYVIGYAGLGTADESSTPEKRAVGLLRYLRDLLRSESFAYSVYNIVMKAHAWPITFVSGPGAATLASIKLKFGKIYEKSPGTTIEEYVKAPQPEIVLQQLLYTGQALSHSAPGSGGATADPNVRSAVDRQTVIGQGQLKYASVTEQMQLSTAKVMSNCTKIAERLVPGSIQLWVHTPTEQIDMTLDKDEIDGHYVTYCEFTPASPEEEARRHADMMNLMKTGALSADTGRRRYLPHIDPENEAVLVEAERLRLLPQVQQLMASVVQTELMAEVDKLNKIKMLKAGMFGGQQMGMGMGGMPMEGQQMGMPGMGMPPPGQGMPNMQPLSMPGGAQQLSAGMRQNPAQSNPQLSPEQQVMMAMQVRNSRAPIRAGTSPFGAGAT